MADPVLDAYTSRARMEGFTEHDAPSVWSDTVAAAFSLTRREEISSSASSAWEKKVEERAKKIGELGGDATLAKTYAMVPLTQVQYYRKFEKENGRAALLADPMFKLDFGDSKNFLQFGSYEQARDFEQRYPGEVLDDEALLAQMRAEFAVERRRDQDVIDRGGGGAAFLGQAGGTLTDPLVLATAPFGLATTPAKTALGTIGKTALTEGAVAMATEIPVQAQIAIFKRDIESPWTFADSAVNVLAAGAGGAVFGGTIAGGAIGYKKALAKFRELKAAGKATRTAETDAAESALEEAIATQEANPLPKDGGLEEFTADIHGDALERASAQAEAGAPVDVAEVVTGFEAPDPVGSIVTRAADPAQLVDVDPLQLHVDAKTFQFKGGGDAEGVTGALRDVERFDRRLAGVALIWERADGRQFIADGHQRVGLARRAIAAGQDPAEVRLNGFVLREADGVTAVDARRMAAIKNMAEGSGSALDAAKILRDVGPAGEAMLPPLPPRSALVRQARGLAALGDEEFLKVVNGVVDERAGALVGAATEDPKLQSAMIEVLRRAKPENEAQARSIVEQVRTQGIETRTTTDLFGEQSFAESHYLERAQVLDAALKLAREDKQIFGGLVRNEDRIAGAGSNSLDRAANLARQQEAADAATQITIRANAKGALSDALSDAARRVREGAKPGTVAKSFLEAARREIFQGDRGRGAPGKARPRGKSAGASRGVEPPIRLQSIEPVDRKLVKKTFRAGQHGQTVEDLYKVAERHQKKLVAAMRELADEFGDDVSVADPGIKGRAGTEEKLLRKGYQDAGEVTDVIRAGFITRTPEQAAALIERMAQKFTLLDDGINVTPMGYIDHVALVRFPDGRVAELQAWSDAMAQAKFKEGHVLYEEARKLTPEQLATPEGAAKLEAINEASRELYARAVAQGPPEWRQVAMMAFPEDMRVRVQDALAGNEAGAGRAGKPGNISSQAARDISKPDSSTSAGLQRDQAPASSGTKKASTPPSSEGRATAGRSSQLKNLSAIDSPPRSIIRAVDDPKSAHPTKSRTGTVEDADYDAVMSQYQDALEDRGQLLTLTQEIDGVVTERPVSGVIDELDTAEETLERVRLCSLPPRAA
jgi:hypothetical protein